MKRLLIALVVVGAMLAAVPATAKKPPKPEPPTDPPPVLVCDFNLDGVLIDSAGDPVELSKANSGIRCQLTADPADSFEFVISGNAKVVHVPYVAVTDVYPNGGDVCFIEYVTGRVTNPGDGVFVFATFLMDGRLDSYEDPSDGNCGTFGDDGDENAYALTFSIGNARGGTVHLTMTPQPEPET